MSEIELDNGKYTVVNELNEGGGLYALRYGEEWRNLAGDNLVLSMYHEIERLRRGIEITIKETRCDDTWDYLNRLIDGKAFTELSYRIGGDNE